MLLGGQKLNVMGVSQHGIFCGVKRAIQWQRIRCTNMHGVGRQLTGAFESSFLSIHVHAKAILFTLRRKKFRFHFHFTQCINCNQVTLTTSLQTALLTGENHNSTIARGKGNALKERYRRLESQSRRESEVCIEM